MLSLFIDIYDSLYFKNNKDAKIVVEEIVHIVEDNVNQKKDTFLIKDDKIELIHKIDDTKCLLMYRMDAQFKWTIGIMITLFGIVIGLLLKKTGL